MNILIVEDDPRIASFLERGLKAEGYRTHLAATGPVGLAMARDLHKRSEPTVLLLDVMLPGMTGLEVCQSLRAAHIATPILMLSALGALDDRVSGLRMGADDYLVKPFEFEELLARIEALARRNASLAETSDGACLVVADLQFDLNAMRVQRGGLVLTLTAREMALLELMMSAPGRLFSRERILSNVWGVNEDPLTNVVDVFIRRLRSKIDDGRTQPLIHTVRGLGYRLEAL
ncbi:MAG: response regulator transcription factor [Hydrogenophaga sp.]